MHFFFIFPLYIDGNKTTKKTTKKTMMKMMYLNVYSSVLSSSGGGEDYASALRQRHLQSLESHVGVCMKLEDNVSPYYLKVVGGTGRADGITGTSGISLVSAAENVLSGELIVNAIFKPKIRYTGGLIDRYSR